MFGLFRKSPKEQFRSKVRKGFDKSVLQVMSKLNGNSLSDGLIVQSAIVTFYDYIRNSPSFTMICLTANDWNPEDILKEELDRTMKKYLEL